MERPSVLLLQAVDLNIKETEGPSGISLPSLLTSCLHVLNSLAIKRMPQIYKQGTEKL